MPVLGVSPAVEYSPIFAVVAELVAALPEINIPSFEYAEIASEYIYLNVWAFVLR